VTQKYFKMMEKSNNENQVPEFRQIIAGYTDEEIRKVLKKRKLYQKEAADFAIQEAIRRGLIYSEQDLFAAEFKHEPEKFSIFPIIENEKTRSKFKKSIARSLLILGALPLVLGGIKIFERQSLEGIVIFIFGVAWIFTSFKLMSKVNIKLIYFMFFMLILAVVYPVKIFILSPSLNSIDLLITILAFGSVLYGIGFLGNMKD
jgi:hypothetical protein